MKQLTKLRKWNPFAWMILSFFVLCFVISTTFGLLFYYTGKVIKGLGYYCLFNFHSAKQEFTNFWSVRTDIRDAF